MKTEILFIAVRFFLFSTTDNTNLHRFIAFYPFNPWSFLLFFFGFFRHGFVVAFAAERLIAFGFAQHHEFIAGDGTM